MADSIINIGVAVETTQFTTSMASIRSTAIESVATVSEAFSSLSSERVMQSSFEDAKAAAESFFDLLGVKAPQAVTEFLARSKTIGPALAAAFNGIAIIGLIQLLVQVAQKVAEFARSLSDLSAAEKKAHQDAIQNANQRLELASRELRAQYELQIAKATGIEKDRLRLQMETAIAHAYQQRAGALEQEHRKLQALSEDEHNLSQAAERRIGQAPWFIKILPAGTEAFNLFAAGLASIHQGRSEAARKAAEDMAIPQRSAEADLKESQARQINARQSFTAAIARENKKQAEVQVSLNELLARTREVLKNQQEQSDQDTARRMDFRLEQEQKQRAQAAEEQLGDLLRQREISEMEMAADKDMAVARIQAKRQEIEADAQLGNISAQQRIQSLRDLTEREYQLELAALRRKLILYDKDTVEYRRALKEIEKLQQQHNIRMAQLDKQAAIEQTRTRRQMEQSVAQSMKSSIASAINAMVTGTQSLGQVWKNFLASLVNILAEALAEMITRWIETHILMKIFGIQQTSATNRAKASSDAAVAAAGQFAYYSEVFPPIAPAMAAAAFAEGMAWATLAGTLALAEKGGLLDQDQLVYAHKNEMILPAPLSAGLQKMVGLGVAPSPALRMPASAATVAGPARRPAIRNEHYNFSANISTIDAKGTAQWMRENSGIFYRLIRDGVRAGKLRPAEI